ncbi:MAG: signal peptidase I [Clostridia bacterium]
MNKKTDNKKIDKKKVLTIVNITANVLVVVISIFVLLFAIMAITNAKNGYNNLFGSTILAIKTDSMEGPNKDSFNEGDLVVAKILNDKQKAELKEGDIITFWDMKDGKKVLNTHRIVEVKEAGGGAKSFVTKGDKTTGNDPLEATSDTVIARYQFKVKGVGNILLFMQSNTGFLVFVVLPSILALGYCVYLFAINLKGFNKEKKADDVAAEKEKMRLELLEELKKEQEKIKED